MLNEEVPTDIIDIAEYAAAGKEIPRGRRYNIRIDRKTYVVDGEFITGRGILRLAELNPPERWQVNQRFRFNRVEVVELDEKVDLATCGVEVFITVPLDQQAGSPPRKDYALPEADTDFLNSLGLVWETLRDGGAQWLLIRDFPIPVGYNTVAVDIALMIDAGYPHTQIDMVYFSPALSITAGKNIAALSSQTLEGKMYQRWSRHRTAENPWRPGLDDISTHLSQVTHWLNIELQ